MSEMVESGLAGSVKYAGKASHGVRRQRARQFSRLNHISAPTGLLLPVVG